MQNRDNQIQDVADTALWVAYYRGVESERPDALFHDPYAKTLAGEKGEKIAKSMGSTSKYTQWTLTIRTVLIDRYIEQLIAEGVDTVLNLGAGLDTRPYRMKLPESLQWFEIDQEKIIDHKAKLLSAETPRCRLARIKLDLAERASRKNLFSEINRRSGKVLVLTEGVLPYLTPEQVAELAEDLYACSHFQFWVAEYFAKEVYPYIQANRMKKMKNAPFLFFPDDWFGFFKERGWIERDTKYFGEETLRLKRKIPGPWWAFVFRLFASRERRKEFLRMTGFVLFTKNS